MNEKKIAQRVTSRTLRQIKRVAVGDVYRMASPGDGAIGWVIESEGATDREKSKLRRELKAIAKRDIAKLKRKGIGVDYLTEDDESFEGGLPLSGVLYWKGEATDDQDLADEDYDYLYRELGKLGFRFGEGAGIG